MARSALLVWSSVIWVPGLWLFSAPFAARKLISFEDPDEFLPDPPQVPKTLVIFDWDDTLFPTTQFYSTNLVKELTPLGPDAEQDFLKVADAAHQMFQAALKSTDTTVQVITNGALGWVDTCFFRRSGAMAKVQKKVSKRQRKGEAHPLVVAVASLRPVVQRLGPVVYAREDYKAKHLDDEDWFWNYEEWKKGTFLEVVEKWTESLGDPPPRSLQLVGVGDKFADYKALVYAHVRGRVEGFKLSEYERQGIRYDFDRNYVPEMEATAKILSRTLRNMQEPSNMDVVYTDIKNTLDRQPPINEQHQAWLAGSPTVTEGAEEAKRGAERDEAGLQQHPQGPEATEEKQPAVAWVPPKVTFDTCLKVCNLGKKCGRREMLAKEEQDELANYIAREFTHVHPRLHPLPAAGTRTSDCTKVNLMCATCGDYLVGDYLPPWLV